MMKLLELLVVQKVMFKKLFESVKKTVKLKMQNFFWTQSIQISVLVYSAKFFHHNRQKFGLVGLDFLFVAKNLRADKNFLSSFA